MFGLFGLLNANLTYSGKNLETFVTLSNIKKRLIKSLASIQHHSLKNQCKEKVKIELKTFQFALRNHIQKLI
jgi:hypothetical protein